MISLDVHPELLKGVPRRPVLMRKWVFVVVGACYGITGVIASFLLWETIPSYLAFHHGKLAQARVLDKNSEIWVDKKGRQQKRYEIALTYIPEHGTAIQARRGVYLQKFNALNIGDLIEVKYLAFAPQFYALIDSEPSLILGLGIFFLTVATFWLLGSIIRDGVKKHKRLIQFGEVIEGILIKRDHFARRGKGRSVRFELEYSNSKI